MSKYLMALLISSISLSALAKEGQFASITHTYPNSKREVVILLSGNGPDLNVSYQVRDPEKKESTRVFRDPVKKEIMRRWSEIEVLAKSAKSEFVCVNKITWTIATSAKESKQFCSDKKLLSKLGDFQQSLQMLMF